MADITIASHVAEQCSVTFHDPMLALAWLRVLIKDIPVDAYMALYKALNPGNIDAVANAQHMVDACMGAGV